MVSAVEISAATLGALLSRYAKPGTEGPRAAAAVGADAERLLRIARRCSRLAEKACNEPITPADAVRELRSQDAIRSTLEAYPGVRVTFEGDPRGYVVKLHTPGGEWNTFGGAEEGYGIG